LVKKPILLSMYRYVIMICAALLLAAIVMGCAGRRKSLLPKRVATYHEAYKWKNFHRAAAYVSDAEAFSKKIGKADGRTEVVEFEIMSIRINEKGTEALVAIRRTYTIIPSVTVHSQILEQKWKFDRKKKDWFLVTPY